MALSLSDVRVLRRPRKSLIRPPAPARMVQFGCWLWLLALASSMGWAATFNVTLASLTNHNTSAYSAYNQANFSANFGTNTWIDQSGDTMPVDPTKMDVSLNPNTPGHVSKTDVHTLIPSRPDLRWFAHATPWFGNGSHVDIGLNCNTTTYIQSMVTDMKNRGFNGVVIDWYGQGSSEDSVTQKLQTYLAGLPNNNFTYILMVDKGIKGGLTQSNLQYQVQYAQTHYLSDPNYEREPTNSGPPIVMFFGVRSVIGSTGMSTVKANLGGNMIWVEQGTGYLGEAWEDECFEWTHEFTSGVNGSDPFNLSAVTAPYSTIKNSGKKAFGAMCGNFNGMLTKSVGWSMGKYLPGSNGLCVVQRAAAINSNIFPNMKRMQWVTWSDWEEGTQVESGIENNVTVTAQSIAPNALSWTLSGDERTVDHYEIYAGTNGVNTAFLGSVRTGVYQTNFSQVDLVPGSYQLYVDAIGKPCIRDHLSAPLTVVIGSVPVVLNDLQPLYQTVWQGDPVAFSVSAGGTPPLSYQWALNGQSIAGATNSTYAFGALPGTNAYAVTISNTRGSANSSTGLVVGAAATFINPALYDSMQITFSGYTNTVGVTNFPVLVRLNPSMVGFAYSQFISPNNGADLRFAAANGRVLPFQIEQWNPAGESLVWVQVPVITGTTDYITAYWGNGADSVMPAANTNGAVWTTLSGSNDFLVVYHLNQTTFPFADSALQYPATSGGAPASTTGIVGRGCTFNGTSQFLNAGLVNVGKTFTASAWVNIAPGANSEQTLWCNKSGGWNVAGFDFYVNSYQTNDGIIYFDTADGVGGNVSARTAQHAVSFGQWHLLTGTLDGVNGAVHVYVDGADQTINTGVDTAFQVTNYVRLGSLLTGTPGSSGNLCFNGTMDEARMEDGVRSPAWVWASWATVARSSFASYGSVVLPPVTLQSQLVNGQVVLTWTVGTLQSALAPTGPYSDQQGVSSPYAVSPSGPQKYFRVRVQ